MSFGRLQRSNALQDKIVVFPINFNVFGLDARQIGLENERVGGFIKIDRRNSSRVSPGKNPKVGG